MPSGQKTDWAYSIPALGPTRARRVLRNVPKVFTQQKLTQFDADANPIPYHYATTRPLNNNNTWLARSLWN